MLIKKQSKTLLLVATIVVSMPLFSSCAAKKLAPAPIEGIDIYDGKNKGDICFSPAYLTNYLQWKQTCK
jgi:hypothetical protein